MAVDIILGTDSVKTALLDKVNGYRSDLYVLQAEVIAARDGLTSLLAKIDAMDLILTEVVAARDGESSLLNKINAIESSVEAATSGSGVLISVNDSTLGFGSTKIVNTDGSEFSINNAGGNETLSIPIIPTDLTKTQANSPYTVLDSSLKLNVIHDNYGATGECNFLLQAAFDGAEFRAHVVAAQYLRVTALAGQTIAHGSDVTASGGYVRCNIPRAIIGMRLKGTVWTVFEISDYWRKDS